MSRDPAPEWQTREELSRHLPVEGVDLFSLQAKQQA